MVCPEDYVCAGCVRMQGEPQLGLLLLGNGKLSEMGGICNALKSTRKNVFLNLVSVVSPRSSGCSVGVNTIRVKVGETKQINPAC